MSVSDNITSQTDRAAALLAGRQPAQAAAAFQEILKQDALSVPQRITATDYLGKALFATGDLPGAKTAFASLVELLKQSFGPEHRNVALGIQNLARVMADSGNTAKAIELGEQALAILKKTADEAPEEKKAAAKAQLAAAHFSLSSGYYNAKYLDRAEELVNAALALWEELKGQESPEAAFCLNNLGRIYEERGRHAEGVSLHKKAVAMRKKLLGAHEDTAFSLGNLGTAQAEAGQLEDAIASLTEAVTIYTELGLGDGNVADSYRKNLEHCLASAEAKKRADEKDGGTVIEVKYSTGCTSCCNRSGCCDTD